MKGESERIQIPLFDLVYGISQGIHDPSKCSPSIAFLFQLPDIQNEMALFIDPEQFFFLQLI